MSSVRMKISVVFLLLLLVCSVSTHQPCLPKIRAALAELSASLARQKAEIESLRRENQAQGAKLRELVGQKTEVVRQKTEIDRLKQQLQVKQVVFSASLVPSGVANLGPLPTQTRLIFKFVLTNIGGAYNPNTGIFTAPVRGAYHFEWHIGVHGAVTNAVLVKNTNQIYAANEDQPSGYTSSSQGASLILEVGDVVFVNMWPSTKMFDNQYHHVTFSGHLLFTM